LVFHETGGGFKEVLPDVSLKVIGHAASNQGLQREEERRSKKNPNERAIKMMLTSRCWATLELESISRLAASSILGWLEEYSM